MESSTIVGGDEEYSSCESGWTTYLEDAFNGNEQSGVVDGDFHVKEGDDGGDDHDDDESGDDGGHDDSDDSMASDASSGPRNQLPRYNTKHAAAQNSSKQIQQHQHHQSTKWAKKSSRDEKEESLFNARTRTTAASRVRSRGKMSGTK